MRVLVIGGTQFFGKHFVEAALARGDDVTVLSRGQKRPAFWNQITHIGADRKDHAAFAAAMRGRTFDVIIDNIAFVRKDVEAAIEAFSGRAGHYILTSSGSVYPDFEPPEIYCPIPEEAADLTVRGDLPYAEGKRECEQVLHEQSDLPFTIIRPPIVQGPDDASLRGWFWYQRVADGGPVLVPDRRPHPIWRQAFSRDIAGAFMLAAGNQAAFGNTYNIASEEILVLDEFVSLVADILEKPDPVIVVSQEVLTREAPWYAPTYVHRFVMDISRIKTDLGFRPTPYGGWLKETVRWHLSAGLRDSAGYERRSEELSLAKQVRARSV
jgi:nucleoside-diphosphate-sugar epimerase